MESHRTRHRLTPIFLVIFISLLISCAKETKKSPQKIYDTVENNSNPSNQEDLSSTSTASSDSNGRLAASFSKADYPIKVEGTNTSSFYLDGKIMNPSKTEGYQKQKGNFKQISITAYTGSEGYFFDLFIQKGQKIQGTHALNINGNQLLLNDKENNLLTVYRSDCDGKPGEITIDHYDAAQNTISGSLSAIVCNNGLVGKRGQKVIQNCRFMDVKLLEL